MYVTTMLAAFINKANLHAIFSNNNEAEVVNHTKEGLKRFSLGMWIHDNVKKSRAGDDGKQNQNI